MYRDKTIAAIIVAAGTGSRMNSEIPKQFLNINGKPMVVRTAEIFINNKKIDSLTVVANAGLLGECRKLLKDYNIAADVVAGGRTRRDSVYEGLRKLPPETDYVLIHDAARPYAGARIVDETIEAVYEKKAVVCAVPVIDSIRAKHGAETERTETLDRDTLYAAQTPQAFDKKLIISAHEKAREEGYYGADDAALVERVGAPVYIIPGSYDNIKITTKADMPRGNDIRVGSGYDVHAFAEGRKLVLGGVEIPYERGLLGYSDADVLIHAVMDALLGAAGLSDIGEYFPDSDSRYEGISSLLLLRKTAGFLRDKGYEIGNIDTVIIAEKPKIAPYVKEMKAKMAEALGVSGDRIGIKATTTEGLGFVGRKEGIAAQASCALLSSYSP